MSRATRARWRAINLANGSRRKTGSRIIAGSLNRLYRKGRMASGESGPPRFISTTAVRAMSSADWLSEQAGERSNVFRRCVWQYSMPKIEDVAATTELLAKLSHRRLDSRTSRDQQNG